MKWDVSIHSWPWDKRAFTKSCMLPMIKVIPFRSTTSKPFVCRTRCACFARHKWFRRRFGGLYCALIFLFELGNYLHTHTNISLWITFFNCNNQKNWLPTCTWAWAKPFPKIVPMVKLNIFRFLLSSKIVILCFYFHIIFSFRNGHFIPCHRDWSANWSVSSSDFHTFVPFPCHCLLFKEAKVSAFTHHKGFESVPSCPD